MLPWPDRLAGDKAHPVPDNVKMLSAVLNVFDNHPLVVELLVAVLFFATVNNGQDLFVRQKLTFHRVDADMVQRLGAAGIAGYRPHILKCLVEVLSRWIANLDKACFLVFTLFLEILGCRAKAAPDMAFDDQSPFLPFARV